MPHRTTLRSLLTSALAALALAGCASGGTAPADDASPVDSTAAVGSMEIPVASGPGIRAGWMNLKPATKKGQIMTLTLLAESSKEGKLIASGRARMDGGKVVSDEDAAVILAAFEKAGFDRFSVKAAPMEGPAGALGAVWIDRGQGFESLFLLPGARQNSETKDLPDVYDGLKKLILTVHQSTPGSSVKVGNGWSGEELLNQKPGDTSR